MQKIKKIFFLFIISVLFLLTSCADFTIKLPIEFPNINQTETIPPNGDVPLTPLEPSIPVEKPQPDDTGTPLIPLEPSTPVEKPQGDIKGDVKIVGNKATNIKLNISVELDRVYNQKEDVALYLVAFKKLPRNYYNREDFKRLKGTWTKENLISCTGGRFSNREGLLPNGYTYIECDIDYRGTQSRNAYRIVYSNKCDYVYYTHDHYASFVRLYNGYTYDGVTQYV